MTTNQTIDGVPRHWAEIEAAVRGAFEDGKRDYNGCMRERLRELRALLDAPIPFPGYPPVPEDRKLPAAQPQPQGEPVAWRFRWDYEHGNGWQRNAVRFVESLEHVDHEDKSTWRDITPLYAEQPAPVAVTPKLEMAHIVRAHMEIPGFPVLTSNQCYELAMKLNACLDEVTSLNGIKP